MSPQLTQAGRFIQIATPLGDDAFVVRSVRGREAVSEYFQFEIELASRDASIKPSDLVAKPAALGVQFGDRYRYTHGFISEFLLLPAAGKYPHYRARLVPWLWFLTQTTDCCIWQNLSALEIIKDVFQKYAVRDFKDKTTRSYPKREYCVQYRETAYDFIQRLMEEEGIFYFFEHTDSQHILVLADAPSAHAPCPLDSTVTWTPLSAGESDLVEDSVHTWTRRTAVRPKQWVQKDYSFVTPHLDLRCTVPTRSSVPLPDLERFDYPGGFLTKGDGEAVTKLRMEQEETGIDVVEGSGDCRSFVPGYRFKLKDYPRSDQDGEYLVLSVEHSIVQGGLFGGNEGGEDRYENTFTCIPHPTPYRPPRVTPKPLIPGPQTAFVVGPSGEEIYVDKYGRIKVQFHWDRYGKYDEKSSCWIRVAQSWASKMWGAVQLPRVGQEVVVEFLEGDPDRPLVTGCVYNAEAMPPYALPDHKTRSTLRTMSSPGGGGFNELRFEDKAGEEQIFVNAERNYDIRIGNDYFSLIKNEKHWQVERDVFGKVGGDQHLDLTGDQNNKVGGSVSYNVSSDWDHKVGSKYAVDAGMEVHLKGGMNVVIEGGTGVTLKVGGNFVSVTPAGVAIKGTMVLLNSGGMAGSGSGASPTSPGSPKDPDEAEPGETPELPPPSQPPQPVSYSPPAVALKKAARTGAPVCRG